MIAVIWKFDEFSLQYFLIYFLGVFKMEVKLHLGHLYLPCLFAQGKIIVCGGKQEGEIAIDEVSICLELIIEMSCQYLTRQDLHKIP